MQAIWKGSISFGLVNIPVKVCGAVNANHVSFNQIHETCKSRIKFENAKYNKDRLIPLSPSMLSILKQYCAVMHPRFLPNDYLFVGITQ